MAGNFVAGYGSLETEKYYKIVSYKYQAYCLSIQDGIIFDSVTCRYIGNCYQVGAGSSDQMWKLVHHDFDKPGFYKIVSKYCIEKGSEDAFLEVDRKMFSTHSVKLNYRKNASEFYYSDQVWTVDPVPHRGNNVFRIISMPDNYERCLTFHNGKLEMQYRGSGEDQMWNFI